jgi:hypothetical protein
MVVFLRPFFPQPGASGNWYPRTIGYGWQVRTLELFAKATSPIGFRALRDLFRVNDLGDLASKLRSLWSNQRLMEFSQSREFIRVSMGDLLNANAIQAAATKGR